MKDFLFNFHRIRREKKMKVGEVCKLLGKNRRYFANLKNPTLETITSIANAIGCTPSELLEGL